MTAPALRAPTARLLLLLLVAVLGGLALYLGWGFERDEGAEAELRSAPHEALAPAGAEVATPSAGRVAERAGASPSGMEELTGRRALSTAGPVALELRTEGELREGLVVARADGAPLPGARLRLVGGASSDVGWEMSGETDGEGRFSLRVPAGSLPRVEVACAGFAPLRRPALPAGEEARFELEPAGAIRGQLEGPRGAELVGGDVLLWLLAADQAPFEAPRVAPVDAGGGFAFEDLATGAYSLGARLPGWSAGRHRGLSVRTGETTSVRLELVRGASLAGRVSFEDTAEPVVGALLRAEPDPSGAFDPFVTLGTREAWTDAEGGYRLEGLAPGSLRISVEGDWGARRSQRIVVGEAGESIERDWELPQPASLSGSVQSEAGLAVRGATVFLSWEEESLLEAGAEESTAIAPRRVDCDEQGRFRVEGLPAMRELQLLAFAKAAKPGAWQEAELAGRGRRLRLRSGEERVELVLTVIEARTLEGRVVDAAGEPVPGLALTLSNSDRKLVGGVVRNCATDAEGGFRFAGLARGSYELHAEPLGHRRLREKLRIPAAPQAVEALELVLEPAGGIAGWVVDEAGESVPWARVKAAAQRLFEQAGPTRAKSSTRADDFGRFELPNLQPGSWSLAAEARGYRAVGGPLVVFTSGDGETLEHELVLERTIPPGSVTVTGSLLTRDGSRPEEVRVVNPRGGVLELVGVGFRLTGVRPGRSSFRFEAPGYLPRRSERVELPEGGRVDLGAIELAPAAEIWVYVRDAVGRPVENFQARLEPPRGSAKARKRGSIALAREQRKHRFRGAEKPSKVRAAHSAVVPFGEWRLVVEGKGFEAHQRSLSFGPEKRRASVEVVLRRP